ncbi:dTDP-glucose 4,6-dehydratase [Sphingomonas sp.]|uniref:dTDP-glucose 4,6-dehydratase n=1 Tax=Sphingomonas sp. TaxID=28214 RepID=UPI0035BC4C82
MPQLPRVFVTGAAGFIGSALVRALVRDGHEVLAYDALTYAGSRTTLAEVKDRANFRFVHADICDAAAVAAAFADFRPDIVTHLAAESHVDRSIDTPAAFVRTNVVGTCTMLEQAHLYWRALDAAPRARFRFHHISTDEVYGSLGPRGLFTEDTAYDPRSPYSASKAGSDHLAAAWWHTYGLPVLITNCSNNYGPYQLPEKLIPLMIARALNGESLPVYGRGANIRDWLHVDDHVAALRAVFERGTPGRSYNVGGNAERRNIDVVRAICATLDHLAPSRRPHAEAIAFVADRPGHDLRYAIDATRIRAELGWHPRETFESGIHATVRWYLDHRDWWQPIVDAGATARRGLAVRKELAA